VQFFSIFVVPNTYEVGDVLLYLSMVFDVFEWMALKRLAFTADPLVFDEILYNFR
jgi:hypothetical protein